MTDKLIHTDKGNHVEKPCAQSSEPSTKVKKPPSNSVAHQILGEFLSALEEQDGYAEIANRLRAAILENKPSEATVRRALFGDDPL